MWIMLLINLYQNIKKYIWGFNLKKGGYIYSVGTCNCFSDCKYEICGKFYIGINVCINYISTKSKLQSNIGQYSVRVARITINFYSHFSKRHISRKLYFLHIIFLLLSSSVTAPLYLLKDYPEN